MLGISSTSDTVQEYMNFLISLLAAVAIGDSPESVYPLLQENLDKLNDNFAQILKFWAMEYLTQSTPQEVKKLAMLLEKVSYLMAEFPLGNIASNKEIALTCYQTIATIHTESNSPQEWAMTQNNLANAYFDRIKGDRAENIECAIAHDRNALRVNTESDFPQEWAINQKNLAVLYINRIKGDKAENIECAIAHYHNALRVNTESDFPQEWAKTQNNLADGYINRIKGDNAENLEIAIAHYDKALRVYTESDFPQDWAMTQNNLAHAYNIQ